MSLVHYFFGTQCINQRRVWKCNGGMYISDGHFQQRSNTICVYGPHCIHTLQFLPNFR